MLLTVLLSACAASSPKRCESPSVAQRQIPPLSEAAKQSPLSEPYLLRAKRNIEQWRQKLSSATTPESIPSESTAP